MNKGLKRKVTITEHPRPTLDKPETQIMQWTQPVSETSKTTVIMPTMTAPFSRVSEGMTEERS